MQRHPVRPPAKLARILAMVLSIVAVLFSIVFGIYLRRMIPLFDINANPERYTQPLVVALVFLLIALLFRMAASVCELIWLERTWTNMPADLRKVGPIDNVSAGLAIGLSFVPGLSWVWKLGLVMAVADGFECVRARVPFTAKVPRTLGMASIIVSWVPGLNVYVAPFLWELFATRMDVVCTEIQGVQQSAPDVGSFSQPPKN